MVDHYENPRNVGAFDKQDPNVGTGLVGAPACGDVMKLQIRVDDEGNVTDACFKTFGCGSAIASSSVATEWVKGKTLDEVTTIKNADIAKHLSLPPVKLHCSMLAEDAIKAASLGGKGRGIIIRGWIGGGGKVERAGTFRGRGTRWCRPPFPPPFAALQSETNSSPTSLLCC